MNNYHGAEDLGQVLEGSLYHSFAVNEHCSKFY